MLKKNRQKIQIKFCVAGKPIEETPRGSAILINQIIQQLGLVEIAKELKMEKHHGVSIEEIILILLLYSFYGVNSIIQLQEKARKDKSLAKIIEDVKKINNKVLHYFQNKNKPATFEKLLDKVMKATQKDSRFRSKKEGIVAVDDTGLAKEGKKMEHIEIVFDHATRRYTLGYVIVAISYADNKKAYPVNFQFRLLSEEERRQGKINTKKKKEKIDLRKKGSLLKMIHLQEQNGHGPELVEVSGVNFDSNILRELDEKVIHWIGIPGRRTPLFDKENNRWDLNSLKSKAMKNNPTELEIQNCLIYSKKVTIRDYGTVEFAVVTDRQGNKLGTFLLKPTDMKAKTDILQEYFSREEVADSNKLKIALEGLKRAKDVGIKAETVVADAWYFVAWFVREVLEIAGIERFVSKLKSNCEIYYKGKWLKVRELWTEVQLQYIRGHFLKVGCKIVEIKGFTNPVKLVFLQEIDKGFQVKAQYVLVCTDTSWSWEKIVQAYKLRWTIECFFRMAKQRYGLQSFHNRKFNEIYCHVTFTFLSYLFSARLKICNPKMRDLTLGQIIDSYFNCLIILKQHEGNLLVYFDPAFANAFGLPFDTS